MSQPVRTLLFSSLYPSCARPIHGIFVETRLRELLQRGGVESRVVAPVPWFYSSARRHGERGAMARTPLRETWNGIDVLHPRYALIPKVGMSSSPLLMALGARHALRTLIDEGFDFDLIDAHYYYPDGVAAALLARWFGKPLVITARGSDVNLIGQYAVPRAMMRWAARQASMSITVSQALAQNLVAIGAPQHKVAVLPNGVDGERFRPEPQAAARQRLALEGGPWLLSVGNLVALKRHELVIAALALLRRQHPDARLAIVGAGPLGGDLAARCRDAGLESAVVFAGAVSQSELRWWYSAADLLVLASSREGWPNVLLEAMACGTPVLASCVGGVPEVVTSGVVGMAIEIEDVQSLCAAMKTMLASSHDRGAIRRYALGMGWDKTSQRQIDIFASAMQQSTGHSAIRRAEVP